MDIQKVTTMADLHSWNLRKVSFEEWAAVLENVGFMHGVGNTGSWLEWWTRLLAYAWMMTKEFVEASKVKWVDWEFTKEGRLRMFHDEGVCAVECGGTRGERRPGIGYLVSLIVSPASFGYVSGG